MLSRKRLKIGTVVFALLFVAVGIVVFRPRWIVTTLAKWSPNVVYFVETEEPVVALTIDDGPDAAATSKILDLLRQHEAHATFFLITNHVPGNEEIVRRTVKEGHELANHLTTDKPSILLSSFEFERRLVEAHKVLSHFSEVRWFRPGSGWYTKKMLSIIHKHGYQCALGSVYPFDPQIPSSWFATQYVSWNVQSGSIIVLHDYGTRGERTSTALATILPEMNRRGFRVVTLSELVEMHSKEKQRA
ncbi:MAG: chitin deacetylase family protein [Desulfobacteraceae bacterium]|jgi:peptidoglycan/xylan/chitin deacetylase (PgdA/CDA1 family)